MKESTKNVEALLDKGVEEGVAQVKENGQGVFAVEPAGQKLPKLHATHAL